MMTGRRADDPAQADLAWIGYHPLAAVPSLATAAVASLLVWTGRWYLDDLSALADRVGALAVFAVAWGVWPVLVAVYLYRALTYTYRVTDRAVLIDFGFWHRPVAPVALPEVTGVITGGDRLSALFGVGWVELRGAGRAVRLLGVRRPEAVAELIRAAVRTARGADAGAREPAKS
jgi:hypothetical protein